MEISRIKSIFKFLLITLLLNACSGNETANLDSSVPNSNQAANVKVGIAAQDNIEEFGKIVKLPVEPEEVTYGEFDLDGKTVNPQTPSPNEKRLIAVLKFSAENAAQIAAQAEKHAPPAPLDVEAESWFPPELIAKSQVTGDEVLKGVSYQARDFFQTPYQKGRLTRINDTNYFVLEMFSF